MHRSYLRNLTQPYSHSTVKGTGDSVMSDHGTDETTIDNTGVCTDAKICYDNTFFQPMELAGATPTSDRTIEPSVSKPHSHLPQEARSPPRNSLLASCPRSSVDAGSGLSATVHRPTFAAVGAPGLNNNWSSMIKTVVHRFSHKKGSGDLSISHATTQ